MLLNTKLATGQFLRGIVKEGGCAGLTCGATIDSEMKDGGSVVQAMGILRFPISHLLAGVFR